MRSEVEAIARNAIEAINDRSLPARARELLDPSIVRHDLVQLFPDSQGPSGGTEFVGTIVAAMPDFRLEIEDLFGADDRVAMRLLMTGTHTGGPLFGRAATGSRLCANAVFIYRIEGGRVAEAWQMIDGLAFLRITAPPS